MIAVTSDAGSITLEFSAATTTLTKDASEKAVTVPLEVVNLAEPDTRIVLSIVVARFRAGQVRQDERSGAVIVRGDAVWMLSRLFSRIGSAMTGRIATIEAA